MHREILIKQCTERIVGTFKKGLQDYKDEADKTNAQAMVKGTHEEFYELVASIIRETISLIVKDENIQN